MESCLYMLDNITFEAGFTDSTRLPFDIDRLEDELGNLLSKGIMAQ